MGIYYLSSKIEFKEKLLQFFDELRRDFAIFLNKNNFDFYLGNKFKLPSIYIFNLEKDYNLNKILSKHVGSNSMDSFWFEMGIDNFSGDFFSTEENKFIIPHKRETKFSQKSIEFMYVSEKDINIPDMYWGLENYIISMMEKWSHAYQSTISVSSFLDYVYSEMKKVGKDYHLARKNSNQKIKHLINLNKDAHSQKYWVDLLVEEFKFPDKRIIQKIKFPKFNLKINEEKGETWIEFKKRLISERIKKLNYLANMLSENIEEYKNIILTETNQKIQTLLIVLTLITVIIGIAQFLGLDYIKELLNL